MIYIVPVVLIALMLGSPAGATEPYAFATTPGKLPKSVVPSHYTLDLKPDMDKLTLAGSEVIDIEVKEPTDRVVLNVNGITVGSAAIDGVGAAGTITPDASAETVTFTFPRALTTGQYKLRVDFTGQVTRFGRGLYVVDSPPENGRKRMLSSQLEPADARRIFPSFDEPAFKASFELAVTVPQRCSRSPTCPSCARSRPAAGRNGSRSSRRRKCRAICSSSPSATWSG